MDGLALRVYNSIHKLGLTEEQIAAVEEEAFSENKGVANMLKCKGYVIYVDHDEKNTINIKKMPKKDMPVPSRIISRILTQIDVPKEAYQSTPK